MADNILKARVRHAYKTDAEWANANPVLLKGEIAYSSDKRQTKTGDGTAHWADLEYDKAATAGTADKANSVDWSNVDNKPTIGNGTVTIKQGGTSKGSFTMNQTGATTIELTDNNTWRGVQDNLTSTATDQSLSANQGKVLNDRTYQMRSPAINSTTDFDTITSPGCYKVHMSAWGDAAKYHSPNSYDASLYSFGLLTVDRALNDGENRIVQVYYPHIGSNVTTGVIVTRMNNGSTWNAWQPITKGMTWANILNKPTTFTPATHNHDSSYLKLTGGTVTGNTAFNKGTASTSVTTGTVTVNGGIGVTGRASTTEVAIADKVILKYDSQNSCLDFVFN